MHLVACATPQDPLEVAPRTALLADLTEGERWEGFWSMDAYYVRCTRKDGAVEWFELADDVAPITPRDSASDVRVLPFRGRHGASARVAVLVAKSPEGRRMLVGTAHRAARSSTRRDAE